MWRKYGKFQILGLVGLGNCVPGKGVVSASGKDVVTQMVRVEVHESRPGLVNLDQGLFVRTRVGPFGTGPSVSFRIQNFEALVPVPKVVADVLAFVQI